MSDKPVDSGSYSEAYYLGSCGGAEFFRLYGAEVPKPPVAYALKAAAVGAGMKVLDVGCGRGELLYQARKAGALAVGTDYAPAALPLAARTSGCPVLRCDAKALPFAGGAFDRVFLLGVADHLHPWELERCLEEIARVLKPGGLLLVQTCVNRQYYKRWTYPARRAAARLGRALGLGLKDPDPPRSEEDEALHVQEHSCAGLRRALSRAGFAGDVRPTPNYKLLARRLYGDPLPPGFPMKPAPRWKEALLLALFRFPLDRWLGRELFAAVARKRP